jgi:hypothetical protein
MYIRNRITAGLAAVTVAFALGACDDSSPSSPSSSAIQSDAKPQFANNSRQVGLVNVSLGEVELLNNVNLAVAANVVATVCDVNVGVAVLAAQLLADGSETFCSGTAREVTIDQAVPGQGVDPAGGNNSRQVGLVNISTGDIEILNNVNAAIVANVLVTACDLNVALAALAFQELVDAGQTTCQSAAGPIDIVQSQG